MVKEIQHHNINSLLSDNFHRDQADIICEVFRGCKLLNFSDELLAKFVSAKAGSLTNRS